MTLLDLQVALKEKKEDLKDIELAHLLSYDSNFLEYSTYLICVFKFDIIAIELEIKNFNAWLERDTWPK